MIRLVVFDLDGTLVDSRKDLADAANALIVALGGAALQDEAIADMIGEGAGVLVRRALAAAGLNPDTPGALQRFLDLYDERLLAHTRPYEGIAEALVRIAPPRTLSVLTNKPQRATERLLDGLGLRQSFNGIIGGDGPFGRKPDTAGLAHLIAEAAATATSTLLVGDSAIDLETARRGGVRVCLARYGFGYRFRPADFRGDELFIDSPLDLPALVESLT